MKWIPYFVFVVRSLCMVKYFGHLEIGFHIYVDKAHFS